MRAKTSPLFVFPLIPGQMLRLLVLSGSIWSLFLVKWRRTIILFLMHQLWNFPGVRWRQKVVMCRYLLINNKPLPRFSKLCEQFTKTAPSVSLLTEHLIFTKYGIFGWLQYRATHVLMWQSCNLTLQMECFPNLLDFYHIFILERSLRK